MKTDLWNSESRRSESLCEGGKDNVVCTGNEAAEVEEALKPSQPREVKDQESNDDGLMIFSKVLLTE